MICQGHELGCYRSDNDAEAISSAFKTRLGQRGAVRGEGKTRSRTTAKGLRRLNYYLTSDFLVVYKQ